jgi:myxalamid-type polyketide synthase MxaB
MRMQNGRHIGKIVLRMPVVPEHSDGGSAGRQGTWLITGGLRGLGLEVARWLAGRGVRHLALLGRRPPDEAAEAVLAALRNDSCTVLVLQGDVSSSEVVTQALRQIESTMPPLRGVVHGAGVLDDGALLNQDWARFRTVLGAKVQGAWLLDRLTAGYELDAFVLFSSMASLLGPAGQANHAAANAFLDALAHDRRRRGLPGTSINWGAWSRIGAVAGGDLEARLATQGVGMIAPEQGLAVLGQVLLADATQVVVLPIDWEHFNRQTDSHFSSRLFEGTDAAKGARPLPVGDILQRLQTVVPARRRQVLVDLLQDEVARVLRLDGSRPPDPAQGFADMGMDSLMAVEVRNRLQERFAPDPPFPATVLFDHPTIADLATHLLGPILGFEKPAETESDATLEKSRQTIVDEIEQLSENDLATLVAEELQTLFPSPDPNGGVH